MRSSTAGRPAIGICPGFRGEKGGQIYLWAAYADAVERAGGLPLVLPPPSESPAGRALVPEMLAHVGAVLIVGGADVDPQRYDQERHPATQPLDPRREIFDLCVLRHAEELGLPVLAICLGIQLMNVARGGTLIQDLPDQRGLKGHDRAPGDQADSSAVALAKADATHSVQVAPGTLLASIVGAGELEVNSSHHQAIDRLGRGLVASAHAGDGLIEAVEDPAQRFWLGVQWHPERLAAQRPVHQALFDALVRAADRHLPPS